MRIADPILAVGATEPRCDLSDLLRRQLVEQYAGALQVGVRHNVVIVDVSGTAYGDFQQGNLLRDLNKAIPEDLASLVFWDEAASSTELLTSWLVFEDEAWGGRVARRINEPIEHLVADSGVVSPKALRRFSQVVSVDIERRFMELSEEWKTESMFMSSTTAMAMLPSYQKIIGMGQAVLPLIFRELEREPRYWFWALRAITDAAPVPVENRGRIREMAKAWLRWGRLQGYKW